LYSNVANIERSVASSDVVIGAVYLRGRSAPVLVSDAMVSTMAPGSVVLDVAVDQGGCIETTRVTSHSDPTYLAHDVVHYGVPNIPGAVPRSSTIALGNVTLPYLEHLANQGVEVALKNDPILAKGVNVWKGKVPCQGVADSLGLAYTPIEECIKG